MSGKEEDKPVEVPTEEEKAERARREAAYAQNAFVNFITSLGG